MATIKSYTDINQSKKLAKILPIESADMIYLKREINDTFIETPIVKPIGSVEKSLCCWSLAALLSVLPESYQLTSNKEGKVQLMLIHHLEKDYYDNPVDACVAMIEKLHELKML